VKYYSLRNSSSRLKDRFAITEVAVQNRVAICQRDPGTQEINHADTDYEINTDTMETYQSPFTHVTFSNKLQL